MSWRSLEQRSMHKKWHFRILTGLLHCSTLKRGGFWAPQHWGCLGEPSDCSAQGSCRWEEGKPSPLGGRAEHHRGSTGAARLRGRQRWIYSLSFPFYTGYDLCGHSFVLSPSPLQPSLSTHCAKTAEGPCDKSRAEAGSRLLARDPVAGG